MANCGEVESFGKGDDGRADRSEWQIGVGGELGDAVEVSGCGLEQGEQPGAYVGQERQFGPGAAAAFCEHADCGDDRGRDQQRPGPVSTTITRRLDRRWSREGAGAGEASRCSGYWTVEAGAENLLQRGEPGLGDGVQ